MITTLIASGFKRARTNEILTGLFFIMASASAIAGLKLYDPALTTTNDFETIARSSRQISLGAFFELLTVCSNIGTAIMLFPYLKQVSERLGVAYVTFRFLESVMIIIGIISLLALVSVASFYNTGQFSSSANFGAEAAVLRAIHDWTFILGPHFILGINTFIYSYVFLISKLVPRNLAVMGLTGAVLISAAGLLEIFHIIQVNSIPLILMAIPIAFYEMILAGWLIVKGFRGS